jgi:hypothetical protein
MTKYGTFFLKVTEDGTAVSASRNSDVIKVRSVTELEKFVSDIALREQIPFENLSYACSSNIDFPEDDTNDPVIISLCENIRNGNGDTESE